MIHCYEFLRFSGYFESLLFGTFFHFPWDFEIAGFDCTFISKSLSHRNFIMEKLILANGLIRCSASYYYKRMCMAMKCFCYFVMQRVRRELVYFLKHLAVEKIMFSLHLCNNFEMENYYYYLTTVFYNQRWENFNYSIYFVSLMR